MNRELTYIHPEAKIADDVIIEPFTTIHKDVEIGSGTWIGSNVTIMDGARIGKNCRIFPGAVISAIPQDLKFKGEKTTAQIGNNTTIRECVTVNRGTKSKGFTKVGDNCLLMAYVHVAHDCVIGNRCIISNAVQIAGEVQMFDWAIVGGAAAIHQFVRIGSHTMISGGSLVRKDVPPYVKAAHEPLSYAGVNSVGLRRRGFDDTIIRQIQEIYRYLYQRGHNNNEALKRIEQNIPESEERENIIHFIRSSERGIMKGYRSDS